ncbi:Glycopeptide antibiotics resistance protein [Paenibacillus sophorae]|uniref:Glycopeptide antibiotics resistance protein n=1 Tax=Paenibacillus sophorae TaxID=1333845 RepID=A0A1H8JYD3_9BACL|nr:VanZ family protein [Paenibacillus sophorae]QWU13530.1 VanZ family protein [Paenibacillus sophorae]SEN85754.1 Glycopeptide antibiotics resistance protein [Paenibacillus sophorae]
MFISYKVWIRRAATACLIVYSACLLYWMFLGFGRTARYSQPMQYSLVPLRTIWYYLSAGGKMPLSVRLVNLLGNVAVFIPFGILMPAVTGRLRSAAGLAVLFIPCITALEILQMLLRAGSFDVDDILLNLLGVWTGFGLLRLPCIMKRRRL